MAARYNRPQRGLPPPPQSTDTTIVFVFHQDKDFIDYDQTVYAPIMAQNKVSRDEIAAFFAKLKEAAGGYKSIKMSFGKIICVIMIMMAALFGFIFSCLYMGFANQGGDFNQHQFSMGIAGMFVFMFIYIFAIIWIARRSRMSQKNLRNKMEVVVTQANTYYNSLGLRWRLPPDHIRWIELWLDYRFAQGQQNMNIGMGQNINTNMNNQGYQPPNYYPQQQGYNVAQNTGYNMQGNNNPYPSF